MHRVAAEDVSPEAMLALDALVQALPTDTPLHDAVASVRTALRGGNAALVAAEHEFVSPVRGASLIGMSRTNLYKVMDSGALPFVRVGVHRRIRVADLWLYVDTRPRSSGGGPSPVSS